MFLISTLFFLIQTLLTFSKINAINEKSFKFNFENQNKEAFSIGINQFSSLPNLIFKNIETVGDNQELCDVTLEKSIKNSQYTHYLLDEDKNSKDIKKDEKENVKSSTITYGSNQSKHELLFNDLKKSIDNHKIISFDIFDTLLVRPYVKPTDTFRHLELLYQSDGFSEARKKAERIRPSKNLKKKDRFDVIYRYINKKYKWLKEKELSLEYNSLKPRPFMKAVYDYAVQQNKTVIIVSDMYLSKKFLTKVLNKNGYTKLDKVYISSEYGTSKYNGSLFNIVKNELEVPGDEILHIGDRFYSDVKQARKRGLHAFHVPKVIDLLFKSEPRMKEYYENHKNDIGSSIMLGMIACHVERPFKNYWYDFGYKFAGPAILGYTKWLDQQFKKNKIDKALFVARDGYTLEKVYNLIKTGNTTAHYIYLPRIISRDILKNDSEKSDIVKEYLSYLKKYDIENNRISVVDATSGKSNSSIRSITKLFPDRKIIGFYFHIMFEPRKDVILEHYSKIFTKGYIINLAELIMTAPYPSVKGLVNGKPILDKNPHKNELYRMKIYKDISEGSIDFAKDYLNYFGKDDMYFESESIINWLYNFIGHPTEIDRKEFNEVKFAWDVNHKKWISMFGKWNKSNKKSKKKHNHKRKHKINKKR